MRHFGRNIGSGLSAQTYVEQYTYLNYGAMTSKRLKVIRGSASGVLETVAEYDGEGRLKSVTYPGTNRKVQYAFNDRGLPSGLTDVNAGTSIVSNVTYGVAGELLTIGGESRTYNINGQLTQLNLPGRVIQYNYTTGQNNGKIDSMVDSGETVTYQYDSLQRLIMASGSTGWTQGYGYDLYGNLTSKTGLNAGNIGVDAGTNRMAGGSYDANGNQTVVPLIAGSEMPDSLTSMSYDVSNRLTHAENNGATRKADYDYDAGNKRIWEKRWVNSTVVGEWMYFFGITGQRMGRYAVSVSGATMTLTQEQASVWFGGKLVEKVDGFGAKTYPSEDRLGSVGKYLPYGEPKPGAANPAADNEKFATYTRDAGTGLDYADQRWHVPGAGRFLTADPYQASGGPGDPGSWNRFGYVGGDPTNFHDPLGLYQQNPCPSGNCPPPPEPQPPIAPTQMKTCPDGSVVPFTSQCPMGPSTVQPEPGDEVGVISAQRAKPFKDVALKALKDKKSCRELLKLSESDYTARLNQLSLSTGEIFAPYVDASGQFQYQVAAYDGRGGVTFNVAGNTFNNPNNVTVNTGSGPQQTSLIESERVALGLGNGIITTDMFQAAYLLHELGHHTGAFGYDVGNVPKSSGFQRQVWKECFGL